MIDSASRRRRLSHVLAVCVLAAASMVVAVGVSSPAQAVCVWSNDAGPHYLPTPGSWYPVLGREDTPDSQTCDGDGFYRGKVYDTYTDGSCVQAFYTETGTVQGTSCDSAGYTYSYRDNTRPGSTNLRLRLSKNYNRYANQPNQRF